jgi:hypothetical protein
VEIFFLEKKDMFLDKMVVEWSAKRPTQGASSD